MVAVGEHRVRITEILRVCRADIARAALMYLRCAGLQRLAQRQHGFEWLVLHLDEPDGLLGSHEVTGSHCGDFLADVVHYIARQHRLVFGKHQVGRIGSGNNDPDAGQCLGPRCVNRHNACARVR